MRRGSGSIGIIRIRFRRCCRRWLAGCCCGSGGLRFTHSGCVEMALDSLLISTSAGPLDAVASGRNCLPMKAMECEPGRICSRWCRSVSTVQTALPASVTRDTAYVLGMPRLEL